MKYLGPLVIVAFLIPEFSFAELRVITTTTTVKSLVKIVGKNKVSVESITKGPQDPHYIETKPSYMIKLRKADLVIANGLELEIGWLENILQGSRNSEVLPGKKGHLELGKFIEAIEIPEEVDRSKGDVHAEGNPHFLLDPLRASILVHKISERLGELDSENKDFYTQNAKEISETLTRKLKSWTERVEKTGAVKIISYHRTLSYFFQRFGIHLQDTIEPKPGVPPSAKHVISLINQIKKEKIKCVMIESFFESNAAERIKSATAVKVLTVSAEVGALEGTDTYLDLIEHLVVSTEKCHGE